MLKFKVGQKVIYTSSMGVEYNAEIEECLGSKYMFDYSIIIEDEPFLVYVDEESLKEI